MLLASGALYPPAWHLALRRLIGWQAGHRGWTVEIGGIEGGLFDATVVHDLHCRRVFPAPSPTDDAGGIDVRLARVEAVWAWRVPFLHDPSPEWLERLTVDGLGGTMDFTSAGAIEPAAARPAGSAPRAAGWLQRALKAWPLLAAAPANFQLLGVNCRVRRGPVAIQMQGARLTGYRDQPGQFLARQVQISGPGFENALDDRSASTAWKGGKLTVAQLALGPGLDLVRVTVDGARLRKRQLDWDSELHALGGSVRSQGTVRFAHGRFGLDVAGSLQRVAVRPLARMIGVEGATDGVVEQGQFSFRGNPEQWTRATVSLAGQATDFRWGQRRWESLDLSAIVLNGRVTVRQLELRQSRNQLSFSGEGALPAGDAAPFWTRPGFTCRVDAKLDDLRSLAQLLGPRWPEVAGRMSVNGALAARTQGQGLDGYLNVEGSALTISGAPLDYLRSTLLFQGEDLNVADVQATRATDYLSGKGTVRIMGPVRYQGELHVAVADLLKYYPAYAGPLKTEALRGTLRLNWSGDGGAGAHSGAFRGSVADFTAKAGPARFSRPIAVEADGSYSPESVSFRQLTLKEGAGDQRRDAIKFEGALPWSRDPAAWQAGQWLDFARPMAGRFLFAEAPLDLIAEAAGALPAQGQVSGWLDLAGPPQAPKAAGALQFRKVTLRSPEGALVEAGTADVRIEDSVARLEEGQGRHAGADWRAGGSVDLHQPARPVLDVTLRSARVPEAVDNALARAEAEVSLSVRGPLAGAEIGGEVRLLNGTLRRRLELGAAETGENDGWAALAAGVPRRWRSANLALHVTAEKPLKGALGGDFTPDLMLGGSGAAPVVSGRVELRKVGLFSPSLGPLTVEAGAVYFIPGEQPRLHGATKDGVVLLGPVDDVQTLPEGAGAREGLRWR